MTNKIKHHLHYCSTLTMRIFATYEEALEDAKFYMASTKHKLDAHEYVKVCFIHSFND